MAIPIKPPNTPLSDISKADPPKVTSLPEIPDSALEKVEPKKNTVKKRRKPVPSEPAPFDDGWRVDEKTGKRYKKLSKVKFDAEGTPLLQNEDFDLDDLNSEADKFLAHLRVAPDKNEMMKLRAEKAAKAKLAREEYERINKDFMEDEPAEEF